MNSIVELDRETGDCIIRLPADIVKEARLVDGDMVDLEMEESGVVTLTRIDR